MGAQEHWTASPIVALKGTEAKTSYPFIGMGKVYQGKHDTEENPIKSDGIMMELDNTERFVPQLKTKVV